MERKLTPQIEVREMSFEFPKQMEKYWFGNSPFKTHLLNSLTLLLPDIEKYLIFNVNQRLKLIATPELLQAGKAFIGQEAQHSLQHTKFWDNLRASGYKIDLYVRCLKAVLFKLLANPLNNQFNLAISAGIEHITTLFAEFALEEDFLQTAEPTLKNLFEWHAVEEIEHKSVVFDVLQNSTSSYPVRCLGLVVSHLLVLVFLNLGLVMLLYQDKKLLEQKVWQEMIQFWLTQEKVLFRVLFNALKYCRKNFHPAQSNNLSLLRSIIT
jgi:uncharacterized protein